MQEEIRTSDYDKRNIVLFLLAIVVCPVSIGYCIVCPFSFGYCIVCPFSLSHARRNTDF
jgi:hypothetical protein